MPELRVTMTGDREGEFIVEEVRQDGSLVVVGVEIWEAERERPANDNARRVETEDGDNDSHAARD